MTETQQEPSVSQTLSDELDLFALARFRALFEMPWQPERPAREARRMPRPVVRREIPPDPVIRVRETGALPASEEIACDAERWDGLG